MGVLSFDPLNRSATTGLNPLQAPKTTQAAQVENLGGLCHSYFSSQKTRLAFFFFWVAQEVRQFSKARHGFVIDVV